jgi:hypothetical protein
MEEDDGRGIVFGYERFVSKKEERNGVIFRMKEVLENG